MAEIDDVLQRRPQQIPLTIVPWLRHRFPHADDPPRIAQIAENRNPKSPGSRPRPVAPCKFDSFRRSLRGSRQRVSHLHGRLSRPCLFVQKGYSPSPIEPDRDSRLVEFSTEIPSVRCSHGQNRARRLSPRWLCSRSRHILGHWRGAESHSFQVLYCRSRSANRSAVLSGTRFSSRSADGETALRRRWKRDYDGSPLSCCA
jgi:hypothetical protein